MGVTVKHTKNGTKFEYSGDLEKAIESAKSELEKKENAKERLYLLWQYERAKRARDSYERRISDLKRFIPLAEEKLAETEGEE